MNVSSFENCLVKWSKEIVSSLSDYQVNIDGKVLKATGKRGKKRGALCLVNAWVSEHCRSLGQSKVAKKGNEKTALPDLINNIDINGTLVSSRCNGNS